MKKWKILFVGMFVCVFLYPSIGFTKSGIDGNQLKAFMESHFRCESGPCSVGDTYWDTWVKGFVTGVMFLDLN